MSCVVQQVHLASWTCSSPPALCRMRHIGSRKTHTWRIHWWAAKGHLWEAVSYWIFRRPGHTITSYQTGGRRERIGMRTFRSLNFACGFDFARGTLHWAIVLPKAQHMSNGRQYLSMDVLKITKLAVTHAQYICSLFVVVHDNKNSSWDKSWNSCVRQASLSYTSIHRSDG